MKREYSSPVMEVEIFEASEYIASCYYCMTVSPAGVNASGKLNDEHGETIVSNPLTCGGNHETKFNNDPEKGNWFDGLKNIGVYFWSETGPDSKTMYHISDVNTKTNAS